MALRMMPRLECFRAASNCGFINASRCIGDAASDSATGSTALSEMKLTSMTTMSGRIGRRLPSKSRMSVSSMDTTLGCSRSDGCNCSRPTSTENTRLAPLASNTSVKPPVDAPTSRQTWPSISIGYCSSAPESLTPPRETKGWAGWACNTASATMVSEGFVTVLPLSVTRPASMAARARARLSNRPRSTSKTSARLREGDMMVSSMAEFNALPPGAQPQAVRRDADAAFERGQITPDIGRRLPRHDQRAAVQIQRMYDHQVVAQGEILNHQSGCIEQ